MSEESKETDDKAMKGSRNTMTLNLKRTVESGHVRQNFSHGRSKTVLVEKKKKRIISAPGSQEQSVTPPEIQPPKEASPSEVPAKKEKTSKPESHQSVVLGGLSDNERDARKRALAEARVRTEKEDIEPAELKEQSIQGDGHQDQETAEKPPVSAAPPAANKAAPRELGQTEKKPLSHARKEDTHTRSALPAEDFVAANIKEPSAKETADRRTESGPKKPKTERPTKGRDQTQRRRGKLTITNALDDSQRERSLASLKRQRERLKKQSQSASQEPQKKLAREVIIPDIITIQALANRMTERAVDVIKLLMKQGHMYKINDVLDADTAQLIAEEFGHTVKRVSEADVEEGIYGDIDDHGDLITRPPIVTVMGHVDHGKTSLLDALRQQNVVAGEAGGITQHIGAYQIETATGQLITFIDTPGHEAFTAMRARGAKVTDIVILVVAADDGVMPQTIEAIHHAKAADVPIIVAINKIDKANVDPNRVRTELLQHEIVVESMSGEVLEVEVSATEKTNLDKLLDAICLQAELLDIKSNPERSAEGVIVEAMLERGRGPVGTMLIQRGTLRVGDIVVAGIAWGKVRALINDNGQQIAEAGPAVPVEVLGFGVTPDAGDQFTVIENESRAREITEYRQRKRRDVHAAGTGMGLSLEQMMSQLKEAGKKEFPLLIKGDVQGSVEAIIAALDKLGNEEVGARIIHSAVGGITESDVSLAAASGAIIIGFNVRANTQARDAATQESLEIRYYAVIYDLIDDVKAAMSGMLSPELRETFLGNAEILEVFNISKVGKIAGCRVTDGKVERGAGVRLIRDDVVMHEGTLKTLKRFKDEVKEVVGGQECGMAFEHYQDMRAGDVIECFQVEEIARAL